MWEEFIGYDKELFLFLNTLGSTTWDGFWMFTTDKFSSIPLYVVLLALSYRLLGLKKTVLLLVAVALLITVTNGLADLFKYGVRRLRPCHDIEVNEIMRLVKNSCGGKFGYFSAHASNAFAIAFFFTHLLRPKFRYIGILLMGWAFLVAYSRIYIGVHFPLDVLSGALVGLSMGWLFARLYVLALQKFRL